jgi:O-acetyl-ADP-ribose deacetylase (regulator of RNase III)
MNNKINIIFGDITKIAVDAIVNAANTSLLGGSGVDGAIHKIGGKIILEECKKLIAKQGSCRTGEAVITQAGNLPAKYVIHTVGPIWNGGEYNEVQLLEKSYLNSLKLSEKYNISSISFPSISTGAYNFPKQLAAEIALSVVRTYIKQNHRLLAINMICHTEENYKIYLDLTNDTP